MSEEDKKLLLEMKHNCLKDNGTSNETYNDSKRIKKAKAIDNVLQEIERLNNIINEYIEDMENYLESDPLVYIYDTDIYVTDIKQLEKNIQNLKFIRTLKEKLNKLQELKEVNKE